MCHINTLTTQWVEQRKRMSLLFIIDQKCECFGRTFAVDREQFEWNEQNGFSGCFVYFI